MVQDLSVVPHANDVRVDVENDLPEAESGVPLDVEKIDSRAYEPTGKRLTKPPDDQNELVRLAALRGADGINAVLRAKSDYCWIVLLAMRAIEVCLGPRPTTMAYVNECDPVAFALRMHESCMLDEILSLIRKYSDVKTVQRRGLAIIELLIMDDVEWRDEVAHRQGAELVCTIAKENYDFPQVLAQVFTVMSYLAAEDYIEIILGQHGALPHILETFKRYPDSKDLMMRAGLALYNMTACRAHVEEWVDLGGIVVLMRAMDSHRYDGQLACVFCGVVANLSVHEDARFQLVDEGLFDVAIDYFKIEMIPVSTVLLVAVTKAMVNFTCHPEWYLRMDDIGISSEIARAMQVHGDDADMQKYGNMYLGQVTRCVVM